jgi:tetratricopeptide (TPR) repeat protein
MYSSDSEGHVSLPAALRRRAFGLAAAVCLVGTVLAQTRVQQDGRLFDANPSLYTGRINQPSHLTSPLLAGNRTATGNARFGFSLQSFSPIGDPTSIGTSLGSATLSAFRRDSVSVLDAPLGSRTFGVVPYFDPALTAPTGSFLRQQGRYRGDIPQFRPGIGGPGQADLLPGQLNYATPLRPTAQPASALSPGDLSRRPQEQTALSSTIFGVQPIPLPGPGEQTFDAQSLFEPRQDVETPDIASALHEPRAWTRAEQAKEQEQAEDAEPSPFAPLDFRIASGSPLEAAPNPMERILEGDALGLLSDRAGQITQPRIEPEDETATPSAALALPQPGEDVFTDMRMALELENDPTAEWFTELYKAMHTDVTEAQRLQQEAAQQAQEFVTRLRQTPLETFAGNLPSPLNRELLEAEALMKAGRYYDAAKHYQRAEQFSAGNPLPLIGRAHALLAAGEYRSAAVALIRALGRFPELARFPLDLESLLGGGEIVDIRRAELLRLLERNDDAQLRFLLGYLEVHSGNREQGLANLERAAGKAEFGSIIRRYPALLRGGTESESLPAGRNGPDDGEDQ